MLVHYAFSQSIVPVESAGALDVLLRFQSSAADTTRVRRPLNLSLVIDRSGSMGGLPLRHAIQAAEALVDQLTPEDILSVVTYDDKVDTILPPQKAQDKAAIHAILRKVTAGGTTNLSGGWLKGCEHVQATIASAQKTDGSDRIHRVLLLTDGRANVGVTDTAVLIKTAGQKAETGVVTTTLGFGSSFNEDLLIGMAQAAGGNFYFIQSPDDAADVFRIEMDSLKSVAAQNLSVTVQTAPGVTIKSLLSSYRAETRDGKMVITMGDVYQGEDKLLALELDLPAHAAAGPLDVLNIAYACDVVEAGGIQAEKGDVAVAVRVGTVEEAIQAAPATDVVAQISRVRIARAKDDAVELADKGDTAGAAQRLRATIADLKQKGLDESFEFAEELDQLEHFAERIEKQQLDANSRKEMRDQSFQGQTRGRADLLGRGTSSGSARDLETISPAEAANQGVQVECFREGGKLRVRAISPGYDSNRNVQFPRSIREEGITYVVDALTLSSDGAFYRAVGKIRRVVLPGQEHRYAGTVARPKSNGKASTVTGSAASLETTNAVGDGVLVQCIKEGSKLRARVVSDGYNPDYNMRFPRDIREEGTLYVVDEVIETSNGGQYVACGKIRRLVQ